MKEVVFGINKLGYIGNTNEFYKLHEKKDFSLTDEGKDIIDTMKHFIIKDLKKTFPEQKLLQTQIVPYDAISGWNIEKLLTTAMKCGLNN
ncbi:MAG: hypothetical protein R2828_25700 [Saprospiraceae bacterium]